MARSYAASNHNIPEAARRILAALHYYDLEPVEDGAPAAKGSRPSALFKTFRCDDVEISIASAATGKPITVTITRTLEDGTREEMLFHYDPLQKILLSAMQSEVRGPWKKH